MTDRAARAACGPRRPTLAGAFCRLLVAGLTIAPRGVAAAADEASIPAVAQPCLACHGAKPLPGAPTIAGQTSNFIQWQLVFFRSGQRKNPIMQALAAQLSDNDIRALGAYFAALPAPAPAPPADDQPDLTRAGEKLGEQRHCNSCHGETYLGQQAAPRIAHQPQAYLAQALSDYRSNARPSSGGAAMTEIAAGLSDDDIKTMAHFLAVLPP